MNKKILLTLALLALMVLDSEACPGLFGGGGGGCCQPSCGCGRKKRSIEETSELIVPSLNTEAMNPCPQNAWLADMEAVS